MLLFILLYAELELQYVLHPNLVYRNMVGPDLQAGEPAVPGNRLQAVQLARAPQPVLGYPLARALLQELRHHLTVTSSSRNVVFSFDWFLRAKELIFNFKLFNLNFMT